MIDPSAPSPSATRSPDPLSGRGSGTAAAASPATEAYQAPAWPNPSLRLDPALGIIVLEFRDRSGSVEATLPTRRELEAYRSAASRGQ